MKMNQLKAMWQSLVLQHFAGGNQVDGIKPELGVFSAAGCPFTRAFAVQTYPDPNHRLDPDFLGGPNGLLQFFQLFDHDNDALVQFSPKERDPDEGLVLITITND